MIVAPVSALFWMEFIFFSTFCLQFLYCSKTLCFCVELCNSVMHLMESGDTPLWKRERKKGRAVLTSAQE